LISLDSKIRFPMVVNLVNYMHAAPEEHSFYNPTHNFLKLC
jgi:hypothetical protein